MKTLLAIVQHRKGRSPGQRFRIEHFIPYLESRGYSIVFSNYLTEADDRIFYSSGRYFQKMKIALKCFIHRWRDLKTARNCDIVFVYREAHMLGTTFFERRFSKLPARLVFDFDDSIWLNDTSDGNKKLAWMKRTGKTAEICRYADMVTPGNEYLAEYARNYCRNVLVIPTTIDTSYHKPTIFRKNSDAVCIGWTGTSTTLKHFYTAIPYLSEIKKIFGKRVYFKVIANVTTWNQDLDVNLVSWTKENEINDLAEFDIGIMPLPDDKWSRGKCGFKGLQCMAMGIPVVMSPVGVNTEIIEHGSNGFLANTHEEWIQYLSLLIESKTLRDNLGSAGRKTVEDKYSVNAIAPLFVSAIEKLQKKEN